MPSAKVKNPLRDLVLVQPDEADGVTKGGIILPDSAKKKTQIGTVIAAGPGKRHLNGTFEEMILKKGDRVLFAQYSGHDVEHDGKPHKMMGFESVLGIVSDE